MEPTVSLLTLCKNRSCWTLTLRKLLSRCESNLHAAAVSLQPFAILGDTGGQVFSFLLGRRELVGVHEEFVGGIPLCAWKITRKKKMCCRNLFWTHMKACVSTCWHGILLTLAELSLVGFCGVHCAEFHGPSRWCKCWCKQSRCDICHRRGLALSSVHHASRFPSC